MKTEKPIEETKEDQWLKNVRNSRERCLPFLDAERDDERSDDALLFFQTMEAPPQCKVSSVICGDLL